MKRTITTVLALLLLAGLLYINAVDLQEAYGNGPPYYDRSSNMDKWINPIPFLLVLDLPAVAASAVLLYWGWRRAR